MIRTDGEPTIAWARGALEAGGHLADDVAAVYVENSRQSSKLTVPDILRGELDTALRVNAVLRKQVAVIYSEFERRERELVEIIDGLRSDNNYLGSEIIRLEQARDNLRDAFRGMFGEDACTPSL